MKITEQDLIEQYQSLPTEELIEMYTKNELTELASSVLVQILKERGVSLENLAELATKKAKKAESFEEDVSPSFLELVDYIRQYELLDTQELIELCKNSELNEAAFSALNQVLEERGIHQETLRELVFEEKEKKEKVSMNNKFVFTYKTDNNSIPSAIIEKMFLLMCNVLVFGCLGVLIGIILDVVLGLKNFVWLAIIAGAVIGGILFFRGIYISLPGRAPWT
jgi:hypothetical protein